MLSRFLYPMHADPRDFGLYPWLEVLREHGRPFRCFCCGVMQQPYRPSVFVPDVFAATTSIPPVPLRYPGWSISSWCVSCAWKLCGRKMVTRRPWWRFWT
jgi:hypothetical protein